MDVVAVYVVPEYVPEYRSGGSAERGIRRSMEDAHLCVDDLLDQLGSRGAFYGVCIVLHSHLSYLINLMWHNPIMGGYSLCIYRSRDTYGVLVPGKKMRQ